jgi:hypothetical protein
MASADARGPIGGPAKRVEVDETLVGGKLRHRGKGKHRAYKTTVSGIIERDGPVAGPVPDEPSSRRSRSIVKTSYQALLSAVTVTMLIVISAAATHTVSWTTVQKNMCAESTPIQLTVTGRC